MVKFMEIKEKDSYKVNISKSYSDIYDALADKNSKCNVFSNDISFFVFAAAVGYKRNCPKDILLRSENSIHCQPISESQLAAIFSIIINDDTIGKNFENFLDAEFISTGLRLIERYAQGGMEILCNEVFEEKWDGSKLIREYKDYDADILRFVYKERMSTPF